MEEKRDAIVKIEVPIVVDDHALRRPGMQTGWDSKRNTRYAEALVAEIKANAGQFDDFRVCAVSLGGGAASNLGRGVADVMRALRASLDVADDAQITMESCVANISGATMPFFLRAKVQRFDFEMLSLNSRDFSSLNRVDALGDLPIICDNFLHAYANNRLGFVLAYGHGAPEGQNGPLNVRRSALEATRTHTAHVRLERVCDELYAGEETEARHLAEVRDVFNAAGFVEYLPLMFAKPGNEDRFALMEAEGAPRIAFGAGATTRLDGVASTNTSDFELYCEKSADFAAITVDVQQL